MRCDQCKFWRRDSEDFGTCNGVRYYKNIEESEPFVETSEKWYDPDHEYNLLKKAKAYVMDCEGYHAALVTVPDFSCALFQQK